MELYGIRGAQWKDAETRVGGRAQGGDEDAPRAVDPARTCPGRTGRSAPLHLRPSPDARAHAEGGFGAEEINVVVTLWSSAGPGPGIGGVLGRLTAVKGSRPARAERPPRCGRSPESHGP
jgi:hypothetical protein